MKRSFRLLGSVFLWLVPTASKRVSIMRKFKVFGMLGDNVHIQDRKIPLYSELIFIHNNVKIASNVTFVTHDIVHKMLNDKYCRNEFVERIGCIEVMDNVFIGSGTIILPNVRINSNVIIGAGSVVTGDVPPNTVYAGVPARCICNFDSYLEKAKRYSLETKAHYNIAKFCGINDSLANNFYTQFLDDRK